MSTSACSLFFLGFDIPAFLSRCVLHLAFVFAVSLATVCPSGFSQTVATTAPAPIAYVYVGTAKGVILYSAASNGTLSLVSGSPFKTTGLMIGSNGKHFISLGTDYVHSYLVASNGAIKQQVSEINTQLYNGGQCGTTGGAIFDHTGQDVYVLFDNATNGGSSVCEAYQTIKINSTSGVLTFNGATIPNLGRFSCCGNISLLPTFIGSDTYAYSINQHTEYTPTMSAFTRESGGTLQVLNFNETGPALEPGWVFYPEIATADPTDHLAVAGFQEYDPPIGDSTAIQLASYTVDSSGDISSTNSYEEMPTLPVNPTSMNMSPSGKLLAVASNFSGITTGLQVYHFDGASPITPYSGTLATAPIDEITWDKSNHLYALSISTSKLYVFTVTPTAITPVHGSPYSIASPSGIFVVPK